MKEQIEIVFDKKTGRFVIHYSGVSSHKKEHEFTDELIAKLKANGYEIETSHFHDAPRIPKIEKEDILTANPTRLREK